MAAATMLVLKIYILVLINVFIIIIYLSLLWRQNLKFIALVGNLGFLTRKVCVGNLGFLTSRIHK